MGTLEGTCMSWPRWARIAAAAIAVVLLIGACASSEDDREASLAVADLSATSEQQTTAEQTTTTERQVTTTTAAPTTTAPPTTTVYVPPPTQPLAPQGGCHPSYDPCVPYASDVDCEGGSGNGPAYTGTVSVVGPDEYGLDSDGDGVGCEQD